MKHWVPRELPLGARMRVWVRACVRVGGCRGVGVWRCGFGCVCYVLVNPVYIKSGGPGGFTTSPSSLTAKDSWAI